jgi:hypothetical protein
MGKLSRRALLGSAAVAAIGAATYGGSRFACSFVPRNHPDFFSLLDVVPQDGAARRIGRAALAVVRLPQDLPAIEASLADRPLIRTALATDCPTTRRSLVQDQCGLDFAEGRTVVVDGWVLSETEAALCAGRVLTV